MFSPFSISLSKISVLFRVSVMSLSTVVSGLDQGFAVLVAVIPVLYPKALMMYNSEGEGKYSDLPGHL